MMSQAQTKYPTKAATLVGQNSNNQDCEQDRNFHNTSLPIAPHEIDVAMSRLKRSVAIDAKGCWNWQGYCDRNGYGRTSLKGKAKQAHRATYSLAIGPIPAGMFLHHLCLNTSCCNPLHLEVVTPQENTRRNVSPPSCNARKTRCDNGHPFDDLNTYHHKARRQCRACNHEAVKQYKARKKGGAS